MNKQEIVETIRRELASVIAERAVVVTDPAAGAARLALRRFQSKRMATTHADLLSDPESSAAAQFFLDDLYGTDDLTRRDADLERVIPSMERLLPAAALKTVAEAIALDALSERLDAGMAQRLGVHFTEEDYIVAYREVTTRSDRDRQLDYVALVGGALCDLVRVPLIGGTLKMMRGPAKLAKLAELHSFLERGFQAFKVMRKPQEFVEKIVLRERMIMENLFAQTAHPFDLRSR